MVYFYIFILLLVVGAAVYAFMLRNRKKQELYPLLEAKDKLERETLSEDLNELRKLNLAGKAQKWYEELESSWYSIQSIDIDELDRDLFAAESYIDKFNFKLAEELIFSCNSNIVSIKAKIANVRKEIAEIKSIEPSNKEKYEEIVVEYKELNREILAKRHQYAGAADTFESDIKNLAPRFESFKSLTSKSEYIEAQEEIQEINLKIIDLKERMSILPEIIKEIEKTTPAQIQTLRLQVEELEKKGFKLSHLDITTKVEKCVWQLNEAREKVKTGDIDLIESILDSIYDVTDELFAQLKKEVEYKKYVEENYAEISNKINTQDKLNEVLYDNIQEIKNRYQIYKEDEEMISKNYDLLGEIIEVKNSIDTYISNQPKLNYKDLKDKIEKLGADIEKIEEEQTSYSRYLTSLREEEVSARNKLNYVNQEKESVRRQLSNTRVPGFSDRFVVLYKEVSDSYKLALEELKKEPMNIDLVKEAVEEVEESLNIYKSEVNNILTDIELIEKLIRYSNRYRKDNIELHNQLTVAEQYYKEYRYNKTLDIIKNALIKVDEAAYERIRKEVKEK